MAALTEERNSPESVGAYVRLTVKDEEVIYAGALVAIDANGEAVNAGDTASTKVIGRAEQTVDNSDDGETITARRGCFWFDNDGNITAANIGDNATVVDNQTVSLASETTNDIVAGKILAVDASLGVLIDTRFA